MTEFGILDPDKIISIKVTPFDASTSSRAIHYIKGMDLSNNEISFDCEGEWVFEDKEKVVINRFTFLDLDD